MGQTLDKIQQNRYYWWNRSCLAALEQTLGLQGRGEEGKVSLHENKPTHVVLDVAHTLLL